MSKQQWDPEIEVSRDLAAALISSQFEKLVLTSIELLGVGWDNTAYLVNGQFVFRFPRRSIAAPLIATEIRVLPLIADKVPVPIPFPRFVGHPDQNYPWNFLGYRMLRGTVASKQRLSRERQALLAEPFGSCLKALHAIDPAEALANGLGPDLLGRFDARKRYPILKERVEELQSSGASANWTRLLDYMAYCELEGPRNCTIVHGDLYAAHVLLDDDGSLAGLIDWGDVHFGDPALDLTLAHSTLPPEAHEVFWQAYGAMDEATWARARWRAIYAAVTILHYALHTKNDDLRVWSSTALGYIDEALR